ncbi:MAG: AAA family ATPase [Alphaproteobacteria bacterium]
MMGLFKRNNERQKRLESYLKPKWSKAVVNHADDGPKPDIVLDFKSLAERGFLTPGNLSSELARDYGLVKRRLFRRLEYFAGGIKSVINGGMPKDKARPVILMTSSSPAEGKTFSSANLTLSLALDERLKVLLIDADLAKPSMPETFGYSEDKPGLFEYLDDPQASIDDFILRVAPLPIRILPAGQAIYSPAQLLSSDRMVALIDSLAADTRRYDVIILDGPPMLATTEAAALAPIADEVVLVVGTGDATIDEVGSSLDLLGGEDHVSFLMNRAFLPDHKISSYPYGEAMS